MKSPAYNEALAYATEVMKAVKDSCYEIDYPLEQFINASIRIGAALARADAPIDHKDMMEAYKDAYMKAFRSIYWSEILGALEDYNKIPFESLRKKCESLRGLIQDGMKLIGLLTNR